MQNKTTSVHPSDESSDFPNPLAGLTSVNDLLARARTILSDHDFIHKICRLSENLFAGRFWHYQPADLRYHDFAHTLEASATYLDLVLAARRAGPAAGPLPSERQFHLGFAAILLHDTGYLRAQGDNQGTGAKYTHCHVLRSCALAASLLPPLGLKPEEVDDTLGCIRCTGLNGNPALAQFSNEAARRIACLVATADYLGQMAAPDYPEKLPALFNEFKEADDFAHIPPEKRPFKSASALLAATGDFWQKFVLPKLNRDFGGAHRLLTGPDGSGPYHEAIKRNLAIIATLAKNPDPDPA